MELVKAVFLQEGPAREQRVVVLVQELEPQARADHRAHDLPERVRPLHRAVVHRRGTEIRIGASLVEADALGVAEVVVLDRKVVVAEAPREGVELDQVEHAPRFDEARHGPRPAPDVGQPVDRPQPGVDDVEAPSAQSAPGLVDVGAYELGVEAELGGQAVGGIHSRLREVEPAHAGAAARPAQ